jgi:methylmalonyl-CoA mutase
MSNFNTDEFQARSSAAWKQKIQYELDGVDYNNQLLTSTNEGITIKPFYHSDLFQKIQVPKTLNNTSKICQTIYINTEEEANLLAINYYNKGFNALKFCINNPINVSSLFKNLLQKNIEFHFHLNFLSEIFIEEICNFLKLEKLYLNIDIIGQLAKTGNWFTNFNTDFLILEKLSQKTNHQFIIGVQASIYENAGANNVQQVAYALAHAQEYLHKFNSSIATKIQFHFSTGSHLFFEIAKIRAFRYLFQLICEQYQTEVTAQIQIEPSVNNPFSYNYNEFVDKTFIAFLSGFFSGAQTITNTSNNKSCIQNLIHLKSEYALNETFNYSNNCYYIETITKQIAEKALTIFKEIEQGGGFLQQLKNGIIQRKISENEKKEQLFSSKKTAHHLKKSSLKNSRKTLIIPLGTKTIEQ